MGTTSRGVPVERPARGREPFQREDRPERVPTLATARSERGGTACRLAAFLGDLYYGVFAGIQSQLVVLTLVVAIAGALLFASTVARKRAYLA